MCLPLSAFVVGVWVSVRLDADARADIGRVQGDVVGEQSVFCTDNRGMEATAVAEGDVKAVLVPMASVVRAPGIFVSGALLAAAVESPDTQHDGMHGKS
eukprot:3929528-Rhodomonas_salina.2